MNKLSLYVRLKIKSKKNYLLLLLLLILKFTHINKYEKIHYHEEYKAAYTKIQKFKFV